MLFDTLIDIFCIRLEEEDESFNDESETELEYPSFGNSSSPDEVWQEFYAFFSCYSTTRTYTWLDKYDTRQAENRRVSRLMEKENKKERDAAKKERNEAVRELIKFIRKRDKRVQMYSKKLAEKREENKRKTAEKRQKQLDAQAKVWRMISISIADYLYTKKSRARHP